MKLANELNATDKEQKDSPPGADREQQLLHNAVNQEASTPHLTNGNAVNGLRSVEYNGLMQVFGESAVLNLHEDNMQCMVMHGNGLVSPTSSESANVSVTGSDIASDNMNTAELRSLLRNQLEYYFSRENLNHDTYLVSQMDADQYVDISIIATFNQVKRLTSDLQLVVDVLRECPSVQVDESGTKVRPLHKRCIVILREIPEGSTQQEVEAIFASEQCPPFVLCEYASANCWYVTFETEEQAREAFTYIRETLRVFKGQPIMARIKAKPTVSSSTSRPDTRNGSGTVAAPDTVSVSGMMHQQPAPMNYPVPLPHLPLAAPLPYSPYSFPYMQPIRMVQPFFSWPSYSQDPTLAFEMNGYRSYSPYMPSSSGRLSYQGNGKNHRNNKGRLNSTPDRTDTSHNSTSSTPGFSSRHNPQQRSNNRSYSASSSLSVSQGGDTPSNTVSDTPPRLQRHHDNSHKKSYTAPPRHTTAPAFSANQRRSTNNNNRNEKTAVNEVVDAELATPSASQPAVNGNLNAVASKQEKSSEDSDSAFELDSSSFPALPGATTAATSIVAVVVTNQTAPPEVKQPTEETCKLSDIVKGTAKGAAVKSQLTDDTILMNGVSSDRDTDRSDASSTKSSIDNKAIAAVSVQPIKPASSPASNIAQTDEKQKLFTNEAPRTGNKPSNLNVRKGPAMSRGSKSSGAPGVKRPEIQPTSLDKMHNGGSLTKVAHAGELPDMNSAQSPATSPTSQTTDGKPSYAQMAQRAKAQVAANHDDVSVDGDKNNNATSIEKQPTKETQTSDKATNSNNHIANNLSSRPHKKDSRKPNRHGRGMSSRAQPSTGQPPRAVSGIPAEAVPAS